jgi:hypothetical protein
MIANVPQNMTHINGGMDDGMIVGLKGLEVHKYFP